MLEARETGTLFSIDGQPVAFVPDKGGIHLFPLEMSRRSPDEVTAIAALLVEAAERGGR